MRAIGWILAAALAGTGAAAQEATGTAGAFGIGEETTLGTLHAAGYVVGSISTSPATDAAVNRFAFVMEHPDGPERPLYACRLQIGSGEPEGQFPLIMVNRCHVLK